MVFTHYVDRYVKSDRSVLLVNLCIVLILAYVTFLAGVNRVEHKVSGSTSFCPGNKHSNGQWSNAIFPQK